MRRAPARVIPCLLLTEGGLYKTVEFDKPRYVGDPINAVRVFNEKECDELILLDIEASKSGRSFDADVVAEIVSEAFMPVCVGGGVRSIEDFDRAFAVGVEKVSITTAAVEDPALIGLAADRYGSQSVVVGIDVVRHRRKTEVRTHSGTKKTALDPVQWAQEAERRGAGEILVNSIDRDGTQKGYDLDLVREISSRVNVPVIACGGAGSIADLSAGLASGANGVAAGSLFVFNGPRRAVLISYLSESERVALR
ncbi:MAG: imidazole glycerol-phosphate synthase subunit HisF [Actinomycetota bacterium]|jgi:cyclase